MENAMLKIKDNVDLKELEKFGFTTQPYTEYYRYMCGDEYVWVCKSTKIIDYRYFYLGIFSRSKEIPDMPNIKNIMNKLNKAGLVEKVED